MIEKMSRLIIINISILNRKSIFEGGYAYINSRYFLYKKIISPFWKLNKNKVILCSFKPIFLNILFHGIYIASSLL